MQKSCFDFLEDDYPDIYSNCIQIETDFVNQDLENAIKSCHDLSEEITKKVLERENLQRFNNLSQFERLRQLRGYGIMRVENQRPFDSINRIYNNLAHNLNMGSAHICHKSLFEIIFWFYMKYNFEDENKDFEYFYPRFISQKNETENNNTSSDVEEVQVKEEEDVNEVSKGRHLLNILKNLEQGSLESVENENFSELKKYLQVSRTIQEQFLKKVKKIYEDKDSSHLIMICGSVGDGKSHLIAYLNNQLPEVYKEFDVKEDATASYDYYKNPSQTLAESLADFNDQNIKDESINTKFILGINLGTLDNFLESTYSDDFEELSNIIEDSQILDVEYFSNKLCYESDKVTIFSFSDYNLFELCSDEELNFVKSDYLSELFKKITNEDLKNPFYKAYCEDKEYFESNDFIPDEKNLCPIMYNYKLFSDEEVQRIIIEHIIKISIKHKIIIPTRDILDLIYNIIVPPKLLDYTKTNFNEFKHQLLPNLLFDSPQRSDLLKIFNNFDPIISHNTKLDEFIIKLNINQDLSKVLNENIELNKVSILEKCISDIESLKSPYISPEDKEQITSTLIRFALFFGVPELKDGFKDKTFLNYLKYLYLYNIQEPIKYKPLFDEVKNAIYKRNNSEEGFLCVDHLEKFKILKPIKLDDKPIVSQNEDEDLSNKNDLGNKFKTDITIKFLINTNEDSKPLIIDYPLYEYIVKLNNGYKPNRADNEDLVVFDEFINSLMLIKTDIYVERISPKSRYIFKYEEGYQQYSFRGG